MEWRPIALEELIELIGRQEDELTRGSRSLWDAVRMEPRKWVEPLYGTEGGGFWAVGLIGQRVLWYNDIEEGFIVSEFGEFGEISQYGADQDTLRHALARISRLINGEDAGDTLGPPQPVS